MISTQIMTEVEDLRPLERRWDELATAAHAPYCAPAWMLSWWRHCSAPGDLLRVVIVRVDDEVVGIAPFFVRRRGAVVSYRPLAGDLSFPTEPLADPKHREVVDRALARELNRIDPLPDVIAFEGAPVKSRWTDALARAWPEGARQPRVRQTRALPAPALAFQGRTYEEWLSSKSSNFRQQMRRFRRRIEKQGGVFRLASDPNEIERGLAAFVALHDARWRPRGGSNLLRPRLNEMLSTAATAFADPMRFRLWLLDIGNQTVSAQIFVQAGGELSYWNGGFDERWAPERPAQQTILAAIEHAAGVGDDRISFGGGGDEYKYRFADHEDALEWSSVIPSTPRYPLVRLSLVPEDLRNTISNHLSESSKRQLKRLAWGRRPTDAGAA
jgi:CelD/BcsL family acetyltransferase involved in cellulose biosynthesis